jgi:hypothetical protein
VVRAPAGDWRLLAWIDQHATVLEQHVDNGEIVQTVRLPERLIAQIPRAALGAHAASE